MTVHAAYIIYVTLLVTLALLLASYMARVYDGRIASLAPLGRAFLRLAGPQAGRDQSWGAYAAAVLSLNAAGNCVIVKHKPVSYTHLTLPTNREV